MNSSQLIVANNLKKLMKKHELTQAVLSEKTGLSQKTISNVINANSTTSITTSTLDSLADFFKIKTYHLLIDSLPTEELESKSIERVISCYAIANKESRDNIKRVAELESRYTIAHNHSK